MSFLFALCLPPYSSFAFAICEYLQSQWGTFQTELPRIWREGINGMRAQDIWNLNCFAYRQDALPCALCAEEVTQGMICAWALILLHGRDKSLCQVWILFPVQISLSCVLGVFTSRVRVQVSHFTENCWELPLCPRRSEDCYHHCPHPVLQLLWLFGLPCHTLPWVPHESPCRVLESFMTLCMATEYHGQACC